MKLRWFLILGGVVLAVAIVRYLHPRRRRPDVTKIFDGIMDFVDERE